MEWKSISFTHFRVTVFRNGFDLIEQLPEIADCVSDFMSDEYKKALAEGKVYTEDIRGNKVLDYDDVDKAFLLQATRNRGFLTRIGLAPLDFEGITLFQGDAEFGEVYPKVRFVPSLTIYKYGIVTLSVDIEFPRLPRDATLRKLFSRPLLAAIDFQTPQTSPYNIITTDLAGDVIGSFGRFFNMLLYTVCERIGKRQAGGFYGYQLLDTVCFLKYAGEGTGELDNQLNIPESGRIEIFADGLSVLVAGDRRKYTLIGEGVSKTIHSVYLDATGLKAYSSRILDYGLSLLHAYDVMQGDIKRVARSYRGKKLKPLRYMQEKLFRYEWGYVDLIDFASVVLSREDYMAKLKIVMGIPQRISETNDLLNHYRYGLSGIVGSYETKRSFRLGVLIAILTFLMAAVSVMTAIDFYFRYIAS